MSDVPEISVVMANYNGARYLGEAIHSLQNQTLKSWELIFVDDASQDSSVEMAWDLARADPRITVVAQHENRGPAAARNRAFAMAKGRWIAIFDSDDLLRPRRLEMLRDRARTDRALIVADNLQIFSARSGASKPFLPKEFAAVPRWIGLAEYVDSNRLYSRIPDLGYLKPFISRDLLVRSGIRYDASLRIGEDYDLIVRLLATGLRLRLEPSTQYLYRKHGHSLSHRIQGRDILALIAAHERFCREIGSPRPEVAAALRRRGKSLESMLLYDQVIGMLKSEQYGDALRISLTAPHIWPLLTRPIGARIRRLAGWKARPAAVAMAAPVD